MGRSLDVDHDAIDCERRSDWPNRPQVDCRDGLGDDSNDGYNRHDRLGAHRSDCDNNLGGNRCHFDRSHTDENAVVNPRRSARSGHGMQLAICSCVCKALTPG